MEHPTYAHSKSVDIEVENQPVTVAATHIQNQYGNENVVLSWWLWRGEDQDRKLYFETTEISFKYFELAAGYIKRFTPEVAQEHVAAYLNHRYYY